MDICLVLDLSGSVRTVRDIIIEFAYELARRLPIDSDVARVAAISYSDDAEVSFGLDQFTLKREVLNALSFSSSVGRTGTKAALSLLTSDVFNQNSGNRNGVPDIAVVISDGWSNINSDLTVDQAAIARGSGVAIHSVIVGSTPNFAEMEAIADVPSSEYTVRVASTADVITGVETLLNRLCKVQ
jgi:uncharacterized protein with von Willebrand factor type A (vWA) domain